MSDRPDLDWLRGVAKAEGWGNNDEIVKLIAYVRSTETRLETAQDLLRDMLDYATHVSVCELAGSEVEFRCELGCNSFVAETVRTFLADAPAGKSKRKK